MELKPLILIKRVTKPGMRRHKSLYRCQCGTESNQELEMRSPKKFDGKAITNANVVLKVEITKDDIKKSKSKKPESCAAAVACMREFGVARAKVFLSTTFLDIGETWLRFRTPNALRSELISFDRAGIFQPGRYTLRPIQPSHQATGKRLGSNTKKSKVVVKAKKRVVKKNHVVEGVRYLAR